MEALLPAHSCKAQGKRLGVTVHAANGRTEIVKKACRKKTGRRRMHWPGHQERAGEVGGNYLSVLCSLVLTYEEQRYLQVE